MESSIQLSTIIYVSHPMSANNKQSNLNLNGSSDENYTGTKMPYHIVLCGACVNVSCAAVSE